MSGSEKVTPDISANRRHLTNARKKMLIHHDFHNGMSNFISSELHGSVIATVTARIQR